jgi:hypothetical protein
VTSGLTLSGCSGGDSANEGEGSQSATPTASASVDPSASVSPSAPSQSPGASGTGAAAPRPPRAPLAKKDTAAARKAFAVFVVARWSYALRTNDAGVVTGLSPKQACQGCKDFAAELGKRRKQHWYVDFPGAKVRSVSVTPATAPHSYLARAKVDIPSSRSLFTNGSFRNDNPAHRGATFEVRMTYAKKGYSLLAFQVR